ncbi:serine--tRNA ligase, partial [bacterium F11]
MLDIKLLREDPEAVRKGLKDRGGRSLSDFEKALQLDKRWREVLTELEQLRARRNQAAGEIAKLKKEKKDAIPLIKEMEDLKSRYKAQEDLERTRKEELENVLLELPNIPHSTVPIGLGEEANVLVRENGTIPSFSFKPKDHHDLGTQLGILDFESAAKLSGSAFAIYKGAGAKLERALANFMLDLHTNEIGYKEIATPYLVTAETMTHTGQLPKFEDDLYKTSIENLYLIPTSEVSLANLFQDQALSPEDLPQAVTAFTPCFRREAGSYGKDVRGLIRNHQFNKVELVRICTMEESLKELEILTQHAEEVLKRLELPYRVMALCSGDLGFASTKTYDLEVWMPGYNKYRE